MNQDLVDAQIVLQEVLVAIIDSGVDSSHPSLQNKLVTLPDGSHGISFIPDRNFKGNTDLSREVRRLRDLPSRTSVEETRYINLSGRLTSERVDIQADADKLIEEISTLSASCFSGVERDCRRRASKESTLERRQAELAIHYNIDHNPYQGDLLSTNSDTEPGISVHGTFNAGIITGERNDPASAFSGVAENARLIVIRVTNTGDESEVDEQVAEGIRYAVNRRARIINIS